MQKALSEMTLEELWELFPIALTAHRETWAADYAEMEQLLGERLSDARIARISHIGSTAIRGIWAKDIIDILVEIEAGEDMERVAKLVENAAFVRMSADEKRVSFNRGYTENGFAEKVYHLHLRDAGDNDELFFRDYLNEHSEVAKAYEQLKLRLWKQFEHDRDGYTNAKTEFIRKWTLEAKRVYAGRY